MLPNLAMDRNTIVNDKERVKELNTFFIALSVVWRLAVYQFESPRSLSLSVYLTTLSHWCIWFGVLFFAVF